MYEIVNDDSMEVLTRMVDNSVDAIVTDPPYGLSFMGKKWDYDVPSKELWAECLRVLKPGGYLLSFAGSRTYHRMAVNIEDAGFEIRDQIMWLYGSGFPKSLNVGKAIDKLQGNEREDLGENPYNKLRGSGSSELGKMLNTMQGKGRISKGDSAYEGWGTALKPAHEPIVMARKPFKGTVANNVLEHGTGAINIDASRISYNGEKPNIGGRGAHGRGDGYGFKPMDEVKATKRQARNEDSGYGFNNENNDVATADPKGRWPANIIFDEEAGAMLDEQSGTTKSPTTYKRNADGFGQTSYGFGESAGVESANYGDIGGASRFFYCAKASKSERNAGLDALEGQLKYAHDAKGGEMGIFNGVAGDEDWTKKNPNPPVPNFHPTVKPVALMEYLVRMVTPVDGLVLDPFLGSGTTGVAAIKNDFHFIGIEREAEYIPIAEGRMVHAKDKIVVIEEVEDTWL